MTRETQDQVKGFEGSLHKNFRTEREAQLYIDENTVTTEVVIRGDDPEDVLCSINEGVQRLTLKHSPSPSSASASSDLSDG